MTPEEIRRLYQREEPATEAQAADSAKRVRSDPGEARALLKSMAALAGTDEAFSILANVFIGSMVMRLIQERAETDDAYALLCGDQILTLMDKLAFKRTPRGKQRSKPTRTA